jgi:hypothetical protein
MRIRYIDKKFQPATVEVIEQATAICEEYATSGFSLTLRQLYYQFVARDLLQNNQKSYDRLGSIISDARLAGQFDWDFIVDRTRNLADLSHWASPAALVKSAAKQYRTDIWAPQKKRVEVWIEKDAAIGVIERVCQDNDVPYFSCRGYTSSSEMWSAATRIGGYLRNGEQTTILHIGDHDPSGLDMTRDIQDRLRLFIHQDWAGEFMGSGAHTRGGIKRSMRDSMRINGSAIEDHEDPWSVKRIALTYGQIQQYSPPPNYAKQSDSRFEQYQADTGLDESWELDALDPFVMEQLILTEIDAVRVEEKYDEALLAQELDRSVLTAVSANWDAIKTQYSDSPATLDSNTDTDAEDDEDGE